jgi:rRNA maturation RNase YbeY
VALLIIHGILHLLGHDHADPSEEQAMKALERSTLNALTLAHGDHR